ncbi:MULTISPECIES: hypothetical protein [unclassified Wolbachia]|uniref:hypothetical protein n=1 Tax=unclassified Wolbachia TaxID=2640676 RepID=UPI002232C5D3|nr:hypothetical protein [Wolbachia endosymbiont (group B) of Protocalliphora azurea]
MGNSKIHTSSEDAVCVGLNFDLDNNERLQLSTQNFLERESSLMERLFNGSVARIQESVRDYLLYPAFGVPAVPGVRNRGGVSARDRRIFLYTTGFTFGNTAFAKKRIMLTRGNWVDVTKHLFHYHDDDEMLDPQGGITQVNVGDRALTMVLYASLGREKRVIVLNVRHMLATHQFPEQGLDLSHWPDTRVYEVVCELDPARRAEDDLGLTVGVTLFHSPALYLQSKVGGSFLGEFSQIGGVSNVHSIADIMMNTGWQVQNRHAQMFQAISNVLFPLSIEQNESVKPGRNSSI